MNSTTNVPKHMFEDLIAITSVCCEGVPAAADAVDDGLGAVDRDKFYTPECPPILSNMWFADLC